MRRLMKPRLQFLTFILIALVLWSMSALSQTPTAKKEHPTSKFKVVATFEFGSSIRTIAFSPDSNRLFAATPYLGKLLDFRARKELKIKTVAYPEEAFRNAHFSPDGQQLVYSYNGSKDSGVGLVDVKSWREIDERLVFSQETAIEKVFFSPNGRFLLCPGSSGDFKVWEKSGEKGFLHSDWGGWDAVFSSNNQRVRSVAYSPNGALLAIGGDRLVSVWPTLKTGLIAATEPIWSLTRISTSLAFSANGKELYTLDASSRLDVLDALTGKLTRSLFSPDNETQYEHINHFTVTGNHNEIITIGGDGVVSAWNVESGRNPVSESSAPFGESVDLRAIATSPDGKYFAVGTDTGMVKVFQLFPYPR